MNTNLARRWMTFVFVVVVSFDERVSGFQENQVALGEMVASFPKEFNVFFCSSLDQERDLKGHFNELVLSLGVPQHCRKWVEKQANVDLKSLRVLVAVSDAKPGVAFTPFTHADADPTFGTVVSVVASGAPVHTNSLFTFLRELADEREAICGKALIGIVEPVSDSDAEGTWVQSNEEHSFPNSATSGRTRKVWACNLEDGRLALSLDRGALTKVVEHLIEVSRTGEAVHPVLPPVMAEFVGAPSWGMIWNRDAETRNSDFLGEVFRVDVAVDSKHSGENPSWSIKIAYIGIGDHAKIKENAKARWEKFHRFLPGQIIKPRDNSCIRFELRGKSDDPEWKDFDVFELLYFYGFGMVI